MPDEILTGGEPAAVETQVAPAAVDSAVVAATSENVESGSPGDEFAGWSDEARAQYAAEKGEPDIDDPISDDLKEADDGAIDPAETIDAKTVDSSDDADTKAFLEFAGVTQDELSALPDKAQEKLMDAYFGETESTPKVAELAKVATERETVIKNYQADPVIAARLEELRTGVRHTADVDRVLTHDTMVQVSDLLDANRSEDAVNLIRAKTKELITAERGVHDKREANRKSEETANGILLKVAGMDKRLAVESGDTRTVKSDHPIADVVAFCVKRGMNASSMEKIGADGIYRLYAIEKGWDKERDLNIQKAGRDKLLKNLKTLRDASGTPERGRRSVGAVQGTNPAAFDRETLINSFDEHGNSRDYDRLLQQNEGNSSVMDELFSTFNEATRRRK